MDYELRRAHRIDSREYVIVAANWEEDPDDTDSEEFDRKCRQWDGRRWRQMISPHARQVLALCSEYGIEIERRRNWVGCWEMAGMLILTDDLLAKLRMIAPTGFDLQVRVYEDGENFDSDDERLVSFYPITAELLAEDGERRAQRAADQAERARQDAEWAAERARERAEQHARDMATAAAMSVLFDGEMQIAEAEAAAQPTTTTQTPTIDIDTILAAADATLATPKSKGGPQADPALYQTVKTMRAHRPDMSLHQIATTLVGLGYTTRSGKPLSASHINHILKTG
jgi:hypothetical protein